MPKSLLEQAKTLENKHISYNFSDEDLELIEAWMMDEITLTQITTVKGFKGTSYVYCWLAKGAKHIIQNGFKSTRKSK